MHRVTQRTPVVATFVEGDEWNGLKVRAGLLDVGARQWAHMQLS